LKKKAELVSIDGGMEIEVTNKTQVRAHQNSRADSGLRLTHSQVPGKYRKIIGNASESKQDDRPTDVIEIQMQTRQLRTGSERQYRNVFALMDKMSGLPKFVHISAHN
jgi:hypothetical protein